MTTTNTTQAQPDAQPVKACESFTPLINGGDYRGTICCRCGEKEGAHVQPVTAAHSPLPWFAPVGYGKNLIMTECGRRVALAVQDIGQTPAEYLANAALIVAAVIPLSMLVGFVGMRIFGVSANLLSLGAIDQLFDRTQ